MPKVKKFFRATDALRCDFCKGVIAPGEKYVKSVVKDSHGKYQLSRHMDCDHTATLNESTEWGF